MFWQRLHSFLFPKATDRWLTVLRVGLGLQVILYFLSFRGDWIKIFAGNGNGLISRDLTEVILTSDSSFIPRIGWLVRLGALLGVGESAILSAVLIISLVAGGFLLVGLGSRTAAVTAWFLHLSAVKSGDLMAYGMDNFTTIGLFYLMISPLPDRLSLDRFIRSSLPSVTPKLSGFFQRVLQLHLCAIYLFGGITKCLGAGWWDGTSIWRSLTCPPYNILSAQFLLPYRHILPVIGISVCLLETGYPVFIWLKKTRAAWLVAILAMHVGIGLAMGLYLFSSIMIILNLAAFGTILLRLEPPNAPTSSSLPVPRS